MSPAAWPLRTERLSLRPFRPDDLGWLSDIYSRADVARFLPGEPWTGSLALEKLAERVARSDLDGPEGALALAVEHDGTPVGDVCLWWTDREHRVAETGWVLHPDHTGRGFAREAVAAVLALAFDRYDAHRVVAQMDARNTASARLAAAVGMRREALHLEDFWCKGEWTDSLVFARLAREHVESTGHAAAR